MRTPVGRRSSSDHGGIVLGWLTRITLIFTILGVLGFEVLSIAVAHVQIQDVGQSAGHEAIRVYESSHNQVLAYEAASAYAESHNAHVNKKSFVITDESVSFDIVKVAPTLLMFRWDKLAKYTEVKTTVYEEPLESGGLVS
jgi:hypothetical protein